MGELRIMGRGGDVAVAWDETKEEEVTRARTEFDTYKSLGYLMFRQDTPADTAETVRTFDPEAKRIIIGAPMAGG